jgi:hypothetical protein
LIRRLLLLCICDCELRFEREIEMDCMNCGDSEEGCNLCVEWTDCLLDGSASLFDSYEEQETEGDW